MINENLLVENDQNNLFLSSSDEVSKVEFLLSKSRTVNDSLAAYVYANQAGELALKHDLKREYADSLLIQVEILQKNGAYNEAMAKNMEALTYFKDSDFPSNEAACWRNLGVIYNFLGEHEKQLEYNIKCYEITKTLKDKNAELQILNNIGDNYISLKKYNKALEIFEKNLIHSDSNKKIKSVSLKNIGAVFFRQKEYGKAKEIFEKTLILAREINAEPLLAAAYFYMGKISHDKKEFSEALSYLEKSFSIAKELKGLKKERLIILEALVVNCLELNMSSKALNYHKYYKQFEEELKNQISNQKIKNIQFKFEIQEIEKEKEVLQSQNTLLQEANAKIENQKKELEIKSFQLETANKELRNFAHVVSHDIKEPVRTIKNFTTLLKKELTNDISNNAKEFLGYVENASSRIGQFVSDILEYATTGQEEIKSSKEIVNCNDVIVLINSNLKLQIQESQATINCCNLPIIYAHKSLVLQVFQNLISNSLKFRQKDIAPVIDITGEDKGKHYLFHLKDNGIGIKEENIDMVFKLFTKLNAGSDYEGSGIGLSTVQKILNMYGGDIKVESVFGEGTTFIFTIPK